MEIGLGTMEEKESWKLLVIAMNNDNKWMSKNDHKGIRMVAWVTKKGLLWPKDGYIDGLRNI